MIETVVYDPRFSTLFDTSQDLIQLSDQFLFTEGPIWNSREQLLLFSDIADSKTWTWTKARGFWVLREDTNKANGNAYDQTGKIITCEHATSRLVCTKPDGSGLEVLASHYEGKELNAPNDVVVKSDGTIWFSDPRFGRKNTWIGIGREMELDFQGVFSFDPVSKVLTLAAREFDSPNGLCFSLDEQQMYVADTPAHRIFILDVLPGGKLGNKRLFADTGFQGEGAPDGIKIDEAGNIYCAAQGGLHLYAPDGTRLGIIKMPKQTANFCFGGADLKTLFITAKSSLYRLRVKVPGSKNPYGNWTKKVNYAGL